MIMPELEIHNAVKVAERLRRVVEKTPFGITGAQPEGITITVSIGVAGITDASDISPEELVKKADEALYLSKHNGRNQVSYSPGESE
jgi:diguanylate cyclase (GGDEF)-like protein